MTSNNKEDLAYKYFASWRHSQQCSLDVKGHQAYESPTKRAQTLVLSTLDRMHCKNVTII